MRPAQPVADGLVKANWISNYQSNNGLFANSINVAGNNKGFIWDVRYTNKEGHAYQNKYDCYVWNSGYTEKGQ